MEWLNYHHLLYFWTVAREGGISKAAEKLRLSQPTISALSRSRLSARVNSRPLVSGNCGYSTAMLTTRTNRPAARASTKDSPAGLVNTAGAAGMRYLWPEDSAR